MSVREMKMESVGGLIDGIRRGETTARAGVASALEAADKLNEKLNAFLEIDRQGALKRADQIDALDQTDQASLPLAGVPIAIKDNICVRGMQTSCGSRILGPYHPPYNATVIEHVLAAGAIVLGKTNCDEFAMGSSNENSAFGTLRVCPAARPEAQPLRSQPELYPSRSALTPAAPFVSRHLCAE